MGKFDFIKKKETKDVAVENDFSFITKASNSSQGKTDPSFQSKSPSIYKVMEDEIGRRRGIVEQDQAARPSATDTLMKELNAPTNLTNYKNFNNLDMLDKAKMAMSPLVTGAKTIGVGLQQGLISPISNVAKKAQEGEQDLKPYVDAFMKGITGEEKYNPADLFKIGGFGTEGAGNVVSEVLGFGAELGIMNLASLGGLKKMYEKVVPKSFTDGMLQKQGQLLKTTVKTGRNWLKNMKLNWIDKTTKGQSIKPEYTEEINKIIGWVQKKFSGLTDDVVKAAGEGNDLKLIETLKSFLGKKVTPATWKKFKDGDVITAKAEETIKTIKTLKNIFKGNLTPEQLKFYDKMLAEMGPLYKGINTIEKGISELGMGVLDVGKLQSVFTSASKSGNRILLKEMIKKVPKIDKLFNVAKKTSKDAPKMKEGLISLVKTMSEYARRQGWKGLVGKISGPGIAAATAGTVINRGIRNNVSVGGEANTRAGG